MYPKAASLLGARVLMSRSPLGTPELPGGACHREGGRVDGCNSSGPGGSVVINVTCTRRRRSPDCTAEGSGRCSDRTGRGRLGRLCSSHCQFLYWRICASLHDRGEGRISVGVGAAGSGRCCARLRDYTSWSQCVLLTADYNWRVCRAWER